MLTEERYQIILDQLKKHGIVKIKDLVSITHSSTSTLRRDMQDLENQNLLVRIHGGAKAFNSLKSEEAVFQKENINVDKKTLIGKAAAETVHDNDVLFLDAGTTVKSMIPFLRDKNEILVVTNSIDNAMLLSDSNIETFVIGGQLKISTHALIGSSTINEIKKYNFDKSFIGTNGFDIDSGFTTPDPEESSIKRLAIQKSKEAYVLADNSKYKKRSFCQFGTFNDCSIISSGLNTADINLIKKETNILEAN